ncbi:hypothetical protein [Serratia sarumanii]|uniref:hypothetical protein n=1 Tax=Serratia sarumanii TaxID=3020826 RepID=UPI003F7FCC1B
MKKNINIAIMIIILVVSALSSIVRIYFYEKLPADFNCRAKVYVIDETGYLSCKRKSSADFFLSIKDNGTGYVIVSGSSVCMNEKKMANITETINYTYKKSGGFYSLQLGERDPDVFRIAQLFKDDVIKLKISRLNSNDYVISTPIRPIMICTTGEE